MRAIGRCDARHAPLKEARMIPRRLLGSGVFLALVLFAIAAHAQEASLVSVVTDETKAVLPGATITATSLETGVASVSTSDERGEYRLLRLPPGKYKVQAELQGF